MQLQTNEEETSKVVVIKKEIEEKIENDFLLNNSIVIKN